jgi:hypothetical protein
MSRKKQGKANRATNLMLARSVKASHRITLKSSRVKTPTRLSKVRLRGLPTIKRGKKSIRIQGLLTHGLTERVADGINGDSYDELGPDSEYEGDETITQPQNPTIGFSIGFHNFWSFTEYSRLRSIKIRLNKPLAVSAALLTMILTRTSMAKRERRNMLDACALLWLVARVDGAII